MHGLRLHQGGAAAGGWIWLFAGTAEGPPLAATLLERGWCVRVSVVGAAAARAYRPHPNLELQVGAIGSDAALEHQLQEMQPHWLVDATHPFALQITARLARVCRHLQQPWLQLDRREASPEDADPQVQLVQNLAELKVMALRDERLLLAIGARQLPQALAATPQCQHFARVLDQPGSLQAALACGLPDHHIACLRPTATGEGHLEEALCRRWRITRVLCRQGGGRSERLWRQVCQRLALPLLLLRRPEAAAGLPLAALLEKLGHP
jgi:precorrin-6A/cobalt-precorrin-6A reductase